MFVNILIVLYNRRIEDSETINSLINCNLDTKKFKLFLWDNSAISQQESSFKYLEASLLNYEYICRNENVSLSHVYNEITSCLEEGVCCIFDQDTVIDSEYFVKLSEAFYKNSDIGIFFPYISIKSHIYSPGKFWFYKGIYLKKIKYGRLSSKSIIGVMSGIALNLRLIHLHKLKFDENLSFYGIDTKFFIDYSKKINFIYLLDYNLNHSLSILDPNESIETKKFRFNEYKKSSLYIVRSVYPYFYPFCYCLWIVKNFKFKLGL